MTGKPTDDDVTVAQWREAEELLPSNMRCETPDEVFCVLDAIENEEVDPVDALVEYRYWRSPAGRRQQAEDTP